jgi:phytanoyl-CoA hydroxylase
MKNNTQIKFKKYGFLLKKGLYTKSDTLLYEAEFDKIIKQLKRSGENINARWGSDLTKNLENKNTSVLHTHNVQSFSSKMMEMIQNSGFLDCVEKIIGSNIILHHSKLFLKPPKIGSAFPLHQDWSYFPTKNKSMIAAVIHLTDTFENMGCFKLIPKSHNFGQIKNSDGHKFNKKIHGSFTLEKAKSITANAGDVLFFHSCTLHGSMQNTSEKPRKTILIQLYSGNDQVLNTNHTNVQLVLRGWNNFATRNSANSL